ncbi:MAG: hypothetical protein ACFFCV_21220 [Promethearchaeota archaeon]
MAKKIHHMGMNISPEEHDKWHLDHKGMTNEEHTTLIKKMGITKEEDEQWHKENNNTEILEEKNMTPINPYLVGGGFLNYCIKRNWITQKGKGRNAKYFISIEGIEQLKKKYGIQIS